MLFVVQLAAMNGIGTLLSSLDAILDRAEDDVHEVDVWDADLLEQTIWYQSSRPDERKALKEIAKASLHRTPRMTGPHLRRVDVRDAASAARARSLAHAPLLVLVENQFSDGILVKAALRVLAGSTTLNLCFGDPSKLEPPALKIESAGGHGELPKLIVARLAEAAERGRPPRLLVVTDSDGEWRGDVQSYAQALRVQCAEANVPCPPLNKRTAENYIPDGVWNAWVAVPDHRGSKPMVEALLKLSPDQRDHVRMDNSGKPPWDPEKPNAEALFRNPPVSTADHDLLLQAKLKGKGDAMVILMLQDHAAALDRTDLLARDHRGDLLELVRQIEDEL